MATPPQTRNSATHCASAPSVLQPRRCGLLATWVMLLGVGGGREACLSSSQECPGLLIPTLTTWLPRGTSEDHSRGASSHMTRVALTWKAIV